MRTQQIESIYEVITSNWIKQNPILLLLLLWLLGLCRFISYLILYATGRTQAYINSLYVYEYQMKTLKFQKKYTANKNVEFVNTNLLQWEFE